MKSIERSTDARVRPSPGISATVYPRGYKARGNDGNMWEIIVDSRGTHRWKKLPGFQMMDKSGPSEIEIKTKKQIAGAELLIEDDPESKDEVREIFERKLVDLQKQADMFGDYGEQRYGSAAKMVVDFLRKMYKEGGRIQQKKELFRSALESGYRPDATNKHLTQRLNEL